MLEEIFDRVNKQYYSLQVNHHGFGIPLVKPHGSVDFDMTEGLISWKSELPLNGSIDLNDTPIIRLGVDDLASPRYQAQCIIPNEANKYKKFQWVKHANEWFSDVTKNSDYCVFIGISYFECDRREIDKIIDNLSNECVVIVANPNPPQDFLIKLGTRPVMLWKSYGGPVDESGNLKVLKCLKTGAMLAKCFCKSGLNYQYCPCH